MVECQLNMEGIIKLKNHQWTIKLVHISLMKNQRFKESQSISPTTPNFLLITKGKRITLLKGNVSDNTLTK